MRIHSIEAIAKGLGLSYETRTRFVGRNGQTAPCDLVVPSGQSADIAVAKHYRGAARPSDHVPVTMMLEL